MNKINVIDKLHIYLIKKTPLALQTRNCFTGEVKDVVAIGKYKIKYTKHEDRLLYGIHELDNDKEYKHYIDLETNEVFNRDKVIELSLVNLYNRNRLVRKKSLIKKYQNSKE